jgi:hypothetical protein
MVKAGKVNGKDWQEGGHHKCSMLLGHARAGLQPQPRRETQY